MIDEPKYEHQIVRGNILPKFRDTITLSSALNVSLATFQFRYFAPGVAPVTRSATLIAATPSATAATSLTLEWAPVASDTLVEKAFNYQWRVNINGESAPLDLPIQVEPETDGTPREYNRFKVTPAI